MDVIIEGVFHHVVLYHSCVHVIECSLVVIPLSIRAQIVIVLHLCPPVDILLLYICFVVI